MGQKKRGFKQEPPADKDAPWWKRLYRWTGWRGKTLWDWQALLFVPVTIALIASLIALYQNSRQQDIERERSEATSLQSYLDQMGPLLIEKELRTTKDVDVRNLARARTLTTLDELEPERKRRVLRYLTETGLVRASLPEEQTVVSNCAGDTLPVIPPNRQPVISLMYARLEGIEVSRHGLLGGIDLQQADLANANISNANLSHTSLRGANLFETLLESTDLSNVDLRGACLSNAYLSGANLRDANLKGANLSGAQGITPQKLEQQTDFLEGATMPDGSAHD